MGAHDGYRFEQTLDLFLAEVGGRAGIKSWQIQRAADACASTPINTEALARVATLP